MWKNTICKNWEGKNELDDGKWGLLVDCAKHMVEQVGKVDWDHMIVGLKIFYQCSSWAAWLEEKARNRQGRYLHRSDSWIYEHRLLLSEDNGVSVTGWKIKIKQ